MRDHDLPEGAGIFVVGPTIGLLMWGAAFLAVHALAGCAPRPTVADPSCFFRAEGPDEASLRDADIAFVECVGYPTHPRAVILEKGQTIYDR